MHLPVCVLGGGISPATPAVPTAVAPTAASPPLPAPCVAQVLPPVTMSLTRCSRAPWGVHMAAMQWRVQQQWQQSRWACHGGARASGSRSRRAVGAGGVMVGGACTKAVATFSVSMLRGQGWALRGRRGGGRQQWRQSTVRHFSATFDCTATPCHWPGIRGWKGVAGARGYVASGRGWG